MSSKKRKPAKYKSTLRKAKRVAGDAKRTAAVIGSARAKVNEQRTKLKNVKDDLDSLIRLIGAWLKGDYKKVPMQTIILALSAVIYFVNPLDMVHDYIPGVGYVDDITFIAFIVSSIRQDIEEFGIWEKHSNP